MSDLSKRLCAALSKRYRIERELGRGAMATVFLAADLRHERMVAIKVLDPEVAAAVGPGRFLREIAAVARLGHPHILPLHDSGVADGLLFYVMPFVEGESLRDRLTREKQLPVDDALRIAREVADALSYAHAQGLVHRDIKPENVLLQSGHAVLADFGIARVMADAGGETQTATGMAVGTPAYMSPEQAAGGRELDGRSDLYSLACVLYEMLAGVPPFAGGTAESLLHQHLNVTPRPVTALRPAVPAAVAAALQRALAKSPADRFNPAGRFGEALEGAATGATPLSAPGGRGGSWRPALVVATVVLVGAAVALWLARTHLGRVPPAAHGRTEVAVLPFQNLSAAGPNAYFAGGLHDELLTQLAKVAALKIISRTSVMGYANTTRPLKQIAAELGVGSIVEGSVQVAGNRLRVTVQLIDAATDEHLWAEHYDRKLDDAFAIQSEVAQRIVTAVGAALAEGERRAIIAAPTKDPEAYRLYLQGEEYRRRPGELRENMESAQRLYERAVALDPGFALAHAALSVVHGQFYWDAFDPSSRRLALQRSEAETALRLAPDLPWAHRAMGYVHYVGERDYRRALDEYRTALRAAPNDGQLWFMVGTVQRRLGRWAEMDSAFHRAIRLDPRNAGLPSSLGDTYWGLHRFADAVRAYERALELAPDLRYAAVGKGLAYAYWRGDLDTLRVVLDAMPEDAELGGGPTVAGTRALLALWQRDAGRLLALSRVVRGGTGEFDGLSQPQLCAAWGHRLRGEEKEARAAFAAALVALASAPDGGQDAWRAHAQRGVGLAALGRRADALRELHWIEASSVCREDRFVAGPYSQEARAYILAELRDADPALDVLERAAREPAGVFSAQTLRLDPRWDPIRGHPRFKALLAKYTNPDGTAR